MADLPKPVAQVQRMGSYQGVPAYGCLLTIEAQKRLKVNDPLFSLAELDAYADARVAEAVAEERERWRALLEERAARCERSEENCDDPKFGAIARMLMSVREAGSRADPKRATFGTEAASRGE